MHKISMQLHFKYFGLVLLRSERLSSKRAKLHTVAVSNNRDQTPQLLNYCLFVPHIWVLFFMHILFLVNRTLNTMPTKNIPSFSQQTAHSFCEGCT